MRTRRKPFAKSWRAREQVANRSKETREFENQEQIAPKKIENLRTRSKPSERDNKMSEQGAELGRD